MRGLRGEKGRGVQGLRGKRERRWGGCSRVGPQEWAQGESGANACDRVGVPGGADPAPRPPRWPCGPLPRRGGPAPLFPSTQPHLEQALPDSRGGPHGPPPQIILKQSFPYMCNKIAMRREICVNSWSFIDYLQSPINSSVAYMHKRRINYQLVKWQH